MRKRHLAWSVFIIVTVVAVTAVAAPVIDAPPTVSYPSRRVANATNLTASQSVTLRNTGDANLVISTLATTGDYSIPTPPALPATVAPNASLVVTVVFDPSAQGTRDGTLDIASNDPVTPLATTALTGVGTVATIAVTDIAFGIVNLTTTATQTTTVTNSAATDAGPLTITSATISGGGGWFTFAANGFGCSGQTSCSFGAGIVAPQSIAVRCTPPANASGTMTASVAFASDSDPGGDPVAGVTCTAGRADATNDPTTIALGTVAVGNSASDTVTVTNSGNIPLVFTASKTGGRQAEYAFSGCFTNCTVPVGAARQFTATFTPTSDGAANITIAIASNDPDNSTITIPVTASAIGPSISAPASINFGSVEVVTTATATLTITNDGSDDLQITSASLTVNDGSYAIASGITGAQTVPANGTASWDLTCTPATTGAHPGRFTIISNAFNGATRNITLACTGTEGILIVIPTAIDFGGVPANTVATRSYRLRNTGNLPVTNITAVIAPGNVGYAPDPTTPLPAQILPGAANEVTLAVQFAPLSGTDGGPATMTFAGGWGTGGKPLRVPPVLALDGDGLSTGFDVDPTAIAFGDIRFDRTATQTFCVSNNSQSNVVISQITITPDPGTLTGEFTVPAAQIRRKTCGAIGAGSQQALPATLTPGQQLEIGVTVDPANRTGAMAATLAVISTLPINPARIVALTANSTSGVLTLSPGSTVDFGVQDVQTPPGDPIDLVITNSGDGPLDLRNFTRSDNGANPAFVLTLPPDTTLAPNTALTIPVRYAPTVVTSPNDTIVLSHQVVGAIGGPTSQSITLRGRAIDRQLALTANPVFPPAFRNPGTTGPTRLINVKNLGEAPLRISALMISGDPGVFSIVNNEPVDLPKDASIDYIVRFTPTTIGPANGRLVIVNDDDANPMAEVNLSGTGIDRMVGFANPVVDLGFTGIGLPITIPDALVVSNMNSVDFTIARVDVADPSTECDSQAGAVVDSSVFAVGDAVAGVSLAGGAQQTLAMTFTPTAQGRFVAAARLFIDPDPQAQATICVTGTAVFVDARGGGGCHSGGGSLGGGLAAIVLLVAFGRRARRRMVASALVCVPMAAHADNIALSIFDPTPATTTTPFQVQTPEVGSDGAWVVTATVSHATNPLVLGGFDNGRFINDHRVIERSTLLELGGAYAFLGRFEAGVRLPLYQQAGQPLGNPRESFTAVPVSGTAAGDITAHLKARLWRTTTLTLGGALQVTLPTATEGEFTGTDDPSARIVALASWVPTAWQRRLTFTANAGGVVRSSQRYANLRQGSGIAWGAAATVRALSRVYVGGELYGDFLPSSRMETSANSASLSPVEWLVGVRWLPDDRFTIGVAGGRGLTSAAGAPDLRAVLTLAYSPTAAPLNPLYDARTADRDGDGIVDRDDRCPAQPEDVDGFEDDDGCPELDNDRDGIADTADKCPLQPEDKDGFEDNDGCPDLDNDGDGVADAADKCPLQPEDKDGFEDSDGCPDPDNDHDGILDARDQCPDKPETINGVNDNDGCPDAGDSAVVVSPDRIELLDAVTFTGATPTRASYNVLGQVGATMRAHSEIVRLRVTCHVQATGDAAKDQQLSEQRAQAIRDWLIQWGVAANRVEVRGFGSTKPLVPPNQRGAAALNDRIELIILERK